MLLKTEESRRNFVWISVNVCNNLIPCCCEVDCYSPLFTNLCYPWLFALHNYLLFAIWVFQTPVEKCLFCNGFHLADWNEINSQWTAKKWRTLKKTWFFIHNLNLRLLIPGKSNVFMEFIFWVSLNFNLL